MAEGRLQVQRMRRSGTNRVRAYHPDKPSSKCPQILKELGWGKPHSCTASRPGSCYDNAVMERFFWSLKHEWTKHEHFENLEAARLSMFKYIKTFYNAERLHQTLGYKSPNKFEAEYAPVVAA